MCFLVALDDVEKALVLNEQNVMAYTQKLWVMDNSSHNLVIFFSKKLIKLNKVNEARSVLKLARGVVGE
jgi:hypothetical protein